MVLRPLRKVGLPKPAADLAASWVGSLEEKLSDKNADRYLICRDAFRDIYFPGLQDIHEAMEDESLAPASRLALMSADARNVTLEPEYYAELDADRYYRVKPLLWLWQSFDRSAMGGGNVELGVQLRRALAPFVFARCGRNFKCFQFVEFSFGYNMEVGDDVVVHRHVLLDDRGGIELGNRVSIADYANIYSHTHDVVDQADVTNHKTVLEEGVRITYHATVLSGTRVGTDAMLGAMALASRDLEEHWVHLGIPARKIKRKPNAPPSGTDAQA